MTAPPGAPSEAGGWRPRWPVRLLLSVVGGAALALAFPPWDLWWLAPVAVAILTAAWWRARLRTALLAGYLAGLVFNLLLLSWLRVLGPDAWLVLAVVWSLWWLLTAAGVAAATWWRWWPAGVTGVWVLCEALRGRIPLGGFPWGRVAFSQADTAFTPLASLIGAAGVTAAAVATGAALAALVAALVRQHNRAAVVAGLAVVGLSFCGLLVPLPAGGQGEPASAPMAIVQGSVPRTGLDFNAQRRAVLANHVAETLRLAGEVQAGRVPAPAAVVWPENSSDVDPLTDPAADKAISAAARAIGAPILVGAVVTAGTDPQALWNVGIVWEPDAGPTDMYIKQHPVPFGEYLPGRALLTSLISRFERIPRDFVGGDVPGVLQLGPARIGDVICFEIAYDQLVRETVRAGARALVVQTNNATYGGTAQPAQQLAMSRLRAVEHGRTVMVAATSGITAVMLPDGRISQQLAEQEAATISADVALRDTLTVSDRLGAVPEAVLALVGVVGWSAGAYRRRRALRSGL